MKRNELRNVVIDVLREFPDTRNDDALLTVYVWWKMKPGLFITLPGFDGLYVRALDIVKNLPREDIVKRIRAVIQNDEQMFLPTDPKVIEKRQKRAANFREQILHS